MLLLNCGSSALNRQLIHFGAVKHFIFSESSCLPRFPLVICMFRHLHTLKLRTYSSLHYSAALTSVVGAVLPEAFPQLPTLRSLSLTGELLTVPRSGGQEWANLSFYFPNLETYTARVQRWSWKCLALLPSTVRSLTLFWRALQTHAPIKTSLPSSLTCFVVRSYYPGSVVTLTGIPLQLSSISIPGHIGLLIWGALLEQPHYALSHLATVVLSAATATSTQLNHLATLPSLTSVTFTALNADPLVWSPSLQEIRILSCIDVNGRFISSLPSNLKRLAVVGQLSPVDTSESYHFPPGLTDFAFETTTGSAQTEERCLYTLLHSALPHNLTRFIHTGLDSCLLLDSVALLPRTMTRLDVRNPHTNYWIPTSPFRPRSTLSPNHFPDLPPRISVLNIPSFNHTIRCKEAKLLPRTLTRLCFRSTGGMGPVAMSHLPKGILYLEIVYERFMGAAHFKVLPPNLTFLKCGFARRVPPSDFSFLPSSLRGLTVMNWTDPSDEAVATFPRGIERLSLLSLEAHRSPSYTHNCLSLLPLNLTSLNITIQRDWGELTLENLPTTIRRVNLLVCTRLFPWLLEYCTETLKAMAKRTHLQLKEIITNRTRDVTWTSPLGAPNTRTQPGDSPSSFPWPHIRWMFSEYDDIIPH